MVKIINTLKPELCSIKMNCDKVLCKKLLDYPMTREAFSTNSFNILLGRMGQGKTSLITSFVKSIFKKVFHEIYLFMPSNSRESIDKDIYGKHLPDDHLFETLTLDNLTNVYETLQENSKEKYNSLLIIDDFQAQLKEPEIVKVLQKIITKMRHLRCTIFILCQNFQGMVKPLRELASNIITYNLGKSQLEKLFEEVMQMKKETFEQVIKKCFVEPHDWILINLHRQRNIYRMGDLVQLDDE